MPEKNKCVRRSVPITVPGSRLALVVLALVTTWHSAATARAKDAPDRTLSRHDGTRGAAARPGAPPPRDPHAPRGPLDAALADSVTIEGDGVYGAGILIAPAHGLVLTAQHVIDGLTDMRVTFYDGHSAQASVLQQDSQLDVALLQVPPQPGTPPPIGDVTALHAGDQVFAIGDPRKLAFSVSRGIISYPGRMIEGARYLQTDLPINDGNSGGPVLTSDGQVIGLMSFILRGSQGLSFALPVTYALERFAPYFTDTSLVPLVRRFHAWESAGSQ